MTVWGGVFYVQSFFPHGLCCPDHFALVDVGMPGPHLDPVPLWLRWCLDVVLADVGFGGFPFLV